MLGQPGQIGRQAFRANVVQAFGDDPQGVVNFRSASTPSLSATGLTLQVAVHQVDEAIAVQLSDRFHFVQ